MKVDYFASGGRQLLVRLCLFIALALLLPGGPSAWGSIVWDGEGGSMSWFDPVNWNAPGMPDNPNTVLPPSNNEMGTSAADTQINLGTGAGDGVVYDPSSNDPFFEAAEQIPFPTGYNRQHIGELFLSRNTDTANKLTIKGDLTLQGRVVVGFSSGTRGEATLGTIVQQSGKVDIPVQQLDIAAVDTLNVGYGDGVYEYRGGQLAVSQLIGPGIRLSVGSTANTSDGMRAGPAGIGKLIIHNPDTPGYIRTRSLVTAVYAGVDEGVVGNPNDSVYDPMFDADGVTKGVGIFEFHYDNGATRPIQINGNMTLNNGLDRLTKGTRSSRLNLVLDSAPCLGAACIPNTVGLFDIDFDGLGGSLLGEGDLTGDNIFSNDRVFSSLDGTVHYREGDVVSAMYGSTQYNWTISYSGDITWSDVDAGTIAAITGPGTGIDIVLIGHSSNSQGIDGDFDNDGDVDGRDFLVWQRGNSPISLSAEDLADWQANYGVAPVGALAAIPEPATWMLLSVAAGLLIRRH